LHSIGTNSGRRADRIAKDLAKLESRIAVKAGEYSWRQLAGGGALAGIGFTTSLFIAGQAVPAESDFATAKIAVFAASILSALE
jgi:NhaA family Na+:H+ antiporter